MSTNVARLLFLAVALWWSSLAVAQLPVPALSGRVVDQTSTLSAEQKASLEQTLAAFETRKGTQIVVLIVSTTRPEEPEQYALRVVVQWKLGRNKVDDGALLLIAKGDRAVRIEVGYGLEGVLNDATVNRIIREVITPRFKEQDFFGGISAGVDRMMRVIDGEPLPAPRASGPGRASRSDGQLLLLFFVLALVIGGLLRSAMGRLPGALATGGVLAALGWFLLGAASAAALAGGLAFVITLLGIGMGRHGGMHGHGGFGGFGGGRRGGGGFGGGFGGGGGGFGGGGATGRW